MRTRPIILCFLFGLLVALAGYGCSDDSQTAEDVKRTYALKILEGFSVGYYDVRADRADPGTYTLYDLSLVSGEAIIHADKAHIIINASNDTMMLKLIGVTGADAASGALIEMDDFSTDAVKLAHAVKD